MTWTEILEQKKRVKRFPLYLFYVEDIWLILGKYDSSFYYYRSVQYNHCSQDIIDSKVQLEKKKLDIAFLRQYFIFMI